MLDGTGEGGMQEREEARPTWSFIKNWEEGDMPTPLPVTKEKVSAADD